MSLYSIIWNTRVCVCPKMTIRRQDIPQKLVVAYSDENDDLLDFMKPGLMSSCPQKSVSFCHRVHSSVHRNMSVFVNMSTNMCLYYHINKNPSLFVILPTKIRQYLSSCPQKSVSFCLREHKNMSVSSYLQNSVNICHCAHNNMSIFSSCPQKHVSVIVTTKTCQWLSLCPQQFIKYLTSCPQKSVNFFIVPIKICQCHRIHKNLSMFVIVPTTIC